MHDRKLLLFLLPLFCFSQKIAWAETIPLMIPHSGTVSVNNGPVNGPSQFKFTIINKDGCGFQTNDGCVSYWSNDGTSLSGSEPTNPVQITVNNGAFALKLGDNRLTNMQVIPADIFNNSETYLRVWFKDPNTTSGFERLIPDRQLMSVPYAYRAEVANEVMGSDLVTSNTNVGIGTASPASKLHFVGDQAFFVGNATNGIATMDVNNTGNGPLALFRGNGNVGIGTTNPNSTVDVKGRFEVGAGLRGATLSSTVSDNFQLRTWSNTPNPNFTVEAGDGAGGGSNLEWIGAEGATLRLLKNGGNVGIGTATPSFPLHVVHGFVSEPGVALFQDNGVNSGDPHT